MKQNRNEFYIEEENTILYESNNIDNSKNSIFNKNEELSEIIEKILIYIYNQNINSDKTKKEEFDINLYQNEINNLCKKYENYYIILILLKSIRKLINKYREILIEHPNITEIFHGKLYKDFNKRSNSQSDKISKNMKNTNYFKKSNIIYRSFPKYNNCNPGIRTLFVELYNIKQCLTKSAPIIEKIFETPLSTMDKFSIEQCQKEEYLNILIHDGSIYNEIKKNKDPKLNNILHEITEGNNSITKIMTEKIKKLNGIHKSKKNFEKLLKISETGSSIDEKYPEECEAIGGFSFSNYSNFISEDDIKNNYFLSNESYEDNLDFEIIENQNLKDNTFQNFNMIQFENNITNLEEEEIIENDININNEIINKIKERVIGQSETIRQNIIKTNKINGINNINNINSITINENNNFLDMPNLFVKNTKNINKENLEKAFNFTQKNNITNIINQNINNINNERNTKSKRGYVTIINDDKFIKEKEDKKNLNINNKKENNDINKSKNNKNFKVEKKEIPSDIDDLVKYIVNDDKKETQNKKKKKNRKKTKKKNKNEIENNNEKDETNLDVEDKLEKEENDEIDKIKQSLLSNSINRYKIHKFKFKYRPKWIEKISKYS